jgi:N-acetylglucosamine kinase-like BadF-type ATPase
MVLFYPLVVALYLSAVEMESLHIVMGLGSTFGDEGGGFWLGKLAITKALGIRQGRGDDSEMLDYFVRRVPSL